MFAGGFGVAALTLAACGDRATPTEAGAFASPPSLTPKAGQNVVTQTLTAAPTTLDLGGKAVSTWAYGESLPGPLIRRSEEHTSELQSRGHLVCRLLLEKKKNTQTPYCTAQKQIDERTRD